MIMPTSFIYCSKIRFSHWFNPYLNLIRIIALISVFIYHLPPLYFKNGIIGVDVFILLAGYLNVISLSSIFSKPTFSEKIFIIKTFLVKRFARLKPALLVWGVFFSFVVLLTTSNPVPSISTWLTSFIGLSFLYLSKSSQNYFSVDVLTNNALHTWSLGVEEILYLILILVLLLVSIFHNRLQLCLIIVITIAFAVPSLTLISFQGSAYYNPIYRIWEILLGSTLFFFLKIDRFKHFADNCFSNTSLIAFLLCFLFILMNVDFGFHLNTVKVFSLFIASLVICIAYYLPDYSLNTSSSSQNNIIFKFDVLFSSLGIISYSFYLLHWPIITSLRFFYNNPLFVDPVSALMTLLMSYYSYFLVESRFKSPQSNH